jgi:transcriptional regulator with XRE-family HTH domain
MEESPAEVIRHKFAQRLRHEIAIRNWNQSNLAREASKFLKDGEIARDNVSNYMRGRALPGPAFLLAIAKALNTTEDDLLPERGQPPARDGGMLPATDVRDAGEGFAFIRINRRVPWTVAVKLLEIMNENLKAELAHSG